MKQLALLLTLPLLGACAHLNRIPEPIIVTQQVAVAVVGACVPKGLGPEPTYVDSDEALRSAKEGPVRFQLLTVGREQRAGRLRELEPVIRGCPKEK